MAEISATGWKLQQRELLRAAFAPAFVKYTELVNKVHDPDDWRKYLEFIAKQVGLEEPSLRNNPHDSLTLVNISIGSFSVAAKPMVVPMAPKKEEKDVLDVTDVQVIEDRSAAPVPPMAAAPPTDFAADLDELVPTTAVEVPEPVLMELEAFLDEVMPQ